MTPKVSWRQALAWRMRRHHLEPIGHGATEDVVRSLCGVQAQVPSNAELAIRLRQVRSRPGDVDAALADGRLIRTWAMRAALHLLAPEEGALFLSLIAGRRLWARPNWRRWLGVPDDSWFERFRDAVRKALAGGTLAREELIQRVIATRGLETFEDRLRESWGTLFKPLAWEGELSLAPAINGRAAFTRPASASAVWPGLSPPEEAIPKAIAAYLRAYGPASSETFRNWLSGGWIGKREMAGWFEMLGEQLAEVDVDGDRRFVLAEDVDEFVATRPTDSVRLLGAFDQWVLGPGTGDTRTVPAARRRAVSRQAGWISPIILAGGAIAGTWELVDNVVRANWFREAGRTPKSRLDEEVERLGRILGRELELTTSPARRQVPTISRATRVPRPDA